MAKLKKLLPITRSFRLMEETGHIVAVVERMVPHTKVSQDAFGFGDILAARPGQGVILVQTTDHTHVGSHITKILGDGCREKARTWLQSGGRIVVHGWKVFDFERNVEVNPPELRAEEITLDMLATATATA